MTTEEQREEYYYEDYNGSEKWILETDEETKQRLITGLYSVGIHCDMNDIVIDWTDPTDGKKLCKCTFYYDEENTPTTATATTSYTYLYIEGLTQFDFSPGPLEFVIQKGV